MTSSRSIGGRSFVSTKRIARGDGAATERGTLARPLRRCVDVCSVMRISYGIIGARVRVEDTHALARRFARTGEAPILHRPALAIHFAQMLPPFFADRTLSRARPKLTDSPITIHEALPPRRRGERARLVPRPVVAVIRNEPHPDEDAISNKEIGRA